MSSIKKSIIYVFTFALLGGLITGAYLAIKHPKDSKQVSSPIIEKIIPVVSINNSIIKPYVDEDITILNLWKNKNLSYYDNAITTWTIRDVNKRNIAKQNNLNFIEIWNIEELNNI